MFVGCCAAPIETLRERDPTPPRGKKPPFAVSKWFTVKARGDPVVSGAEPGLGSDGEAGFTFEENTRESVTCLTQTNLCWVPRPSNPVLNSCVGFCFCAQA